MRPVRGLQGLFREHDFIQKHNLKSVLCDDSQLCDQCLFPDLIGLSLVLRHYFLLPDGLSLDPVFQVEKT